MGIGDTLAVFQIFGNNELLMQELIIYVGGPERLSLASLTNLTGICSTPVEQSERRWEISFKTSSLDTFLSAKVDNSLAWSGNDRTRSSKS